MPPLSPPLYQNRYFCAHKSNLPIIEEQQQAKIDSIHRNTKYIFQYLESPLTLIWSYSWDNKTQRWILYKEMYLPVITSSDDTKLRLNDHLFWLEAPGPAFQITQPPQLLLNSSQQGLVSLLCLFSAGVCVGISVGEYREVANRPGGLRSSSAKMLSGPSSLLLLWATNTNTWE